jgi:hypothetical protein
MYKKIPLFTKSQRLFSIILLLIQLTRTITKTVLNSSTGSIDDVRKSFLEGIKPAENLQVKTKYVDPEAGLASTSLYWACRNAQHKLFTL